MQLLKKFLLSWNRWKPSLESGSFFQDDSLVRGLNIRSAVRRVAKSSKSDLIFDPVGYHEFEWIAENRIQVLIDLVNSNYCPTPQIVLNMPKKGLTFRPVSYLLPIDSIIYQAIVDKIIKYKRGLFSKQVYSHIIGDVDKADVFQSEVHNWLKMQENVRVQNRRGCNYYFFSDVSGFFENVKIVKLLQLLRFYAGRNETRYLEPLEKLLKVWHFAGSQGLIQPHHASSILSKVYLAPVDSLFSFLGAKYNRYVDEFHILSEKKAALLGISLELAKKLRELGLNQNAQKSKFLFGEQIMQAFNKDQDFFNHVKYLRNVKMEYTEAREEIAARFSKFLEELKGGEPNYRVFRYCLRRFKEDHDPLAINACFEIAEQDIEQLIDIVKYLAIFASDHEYSSRIASFAQGLLKNEELNYSNWAEAWLFGLLHELSNNVKLNLEYIRQVGNDNNKDDITRSLCYLILSRSLAEGELIGLYDLFEKETSPTIKRALLTCLSRLPKSALREHLVIQDSDDINLRVLKIYLGQNMYPNDSKI